MAPKMPTALGYRMPAEWEPHAATWLAWPHNTVTWPDQLAQVQDIFLRMIAAVHEHETVHLLVHDTATAAAVREHLPLWGDTHACRAARASHRRCLATRQRTDFFDGRGGIPAGRHQRLAVQRLG